MEAKELRLGNMVYYEHGKNRYPCSVTLRMLSDINEGDDESIHYSPIALTEEWLISFGFFKDNHGFRLNDKYTLSFSVDKNGKFLPCFNDRVINQNLRTEYVHQLMNLYFALTGEELAIKQ